MALPAPEASFRGAQETAKANSLRPTSAPRDFSPAIIIENSTNFYLKTLNCGISQRENFGGWCS